MTGDQAEVIGLQALAWLIASDELRPVFLGASGLRAEDMKQQAEDPTFLVSVLDFVLLDDQTIIAFCDAQGLAYDTPMQALNALPGQAIPNWT